MQIDGHFTLTYTLARMVGFEHERAEIIAYSAQYVDDATNSGIAKFDNGAMFSRISSAHTMTAYDMKYYTDAHENHLVWVPFHFLPGNDGLSAGENPKGGFINKLVCKPYSEVAVDMLDACLKDIDKPYFLQRVGITMHVFADTFAHQGFAGVVHDINKVEDLECSNYSMSFFNKTKASALSNAFPMGHGAALTCPDMPFLKWSYTNGLGNKVERDNLEIFMNACYNLYGQLGLVLSKLGGTVNDENESDFEQIKNNLENFKDDNGEVRLQNWIESIDRGDFSFGSEKLEYIPKGINSWKYQAIKQELAEDTGRELFTYNNDFINSHWRNFHVALKAHRFDIVNNILPKYGIIVS